MNSEIVIDCHQSGKFSVDVDVVLERLDWLVKHGIQIIRLTEVSPGKFRAALKRWAKANGWHLTHPRRSGANECAVLSKEVQTGKYAQKATKLRLKIGRTAPTYLIGCHVNGAGWCEVLHTPAHTDGLKKGLWPTRVYFSVVDFFHRLRPRKRRTLSADWNYELRTPAKRRQVESWFDGKLKVAVLPDQDPTEGGRVIDGFATTDEVVKSGTTLRGVPGGRTKLDHYPVVIERRKKAA